MDEVCKGFQELVGLFSFLSCVSWENESGGSCSPQELDSPAGPYKAVGVHCVPSSSAERGLCLVYLFVFLLDS